MVRWIRVFKAVRGLMKVVGDADDDGKITKAETTQILKAMWRVVKAYRGKK